MNTHKLVAVLCLVLASLSLVVVAQTTVKCLDGNTEGKTIGPFNTALTEAQKGTFYRREIPCITCEIDCLATFTDRFDNKINPSPFASCPCRYIRYGCLASQPCVEMNSATPKQWDAATQLCLAHGCVAKPDVSSPNYDNKLYNKYSIGQNTWKLANRDCYKASSNGDAYRKKQQYFNELNSAATDGNVINLTGANAVSRMCELGYYRRAFDEAVASFKAGRITARQVLQNAYQFANYAVDVSSPLLLYQFLVFSRGYDLTNATDRSQLMAYANPLLGNINADILARNGLFRVTDVELNSLLDQKRNCPGGKTRADSFLDLIDKFVISLKYRDSCKPGQIETYFDAQFKAMTSALGVSVADIYDDQDMGRNFVYPYLFKPASRSQISFMDSRFTKVSNSHFKFIESNYPLCPVFGSLPPCVRTAIANNAATLF